MSRMSRPPRPSTGAIMNLTSLQARFYELTGHDGRDRQVTGRIELWQPGAQPGVIPKPQDEIATGHRLQPEVRRLEHDCRFILEADGQAIREPDPCPGRG